MNIKDFNDQQLVNSLNKGDETAITEIYHRYWRKLLAIAYNQTKDKTAAEEVVQEVLINLWDRRASLKIDSLPNYLATAVKYTVLNSIQREKRRNTIAVGVFGNASASFDDEEIYAHLLRDYINGVVETLPDKCKLVFKCSREQGKSIPQIAKELNIAEKTVEAHLTKALKTIRYTLKSTGIFTFIFFLSNFK